MSEAGDVQETQPNEEKEPAISLNVAVLAEGEVRDMAIEMSRKLSSRFPTEFTLNTKDNHPHISIYQGRFPERNLQNLQAAVGILSETLKPISFDMGDISIDYGTYIWWNAKKQRNFLLFKKI